MTEPRQRIKHIPVVVADVVQETADTVTLLLDAGDDPRDYKAGQYVSVDPHQFPAIKGYAAFLEDNKGRKEPPRAYSMVSTPDERYLAITVKEELYDKTAMKYPPLLSPFLVHHPLKGARMEVTGYAGGYHLPEDIANRTDHVVHLCAGSGSVPNVSMIKWGLANVPTLRQTFIYSNKTWNDIIYRDELARMVAAHPERLRVVHALTREPESFPYTDTVRRGRVSPDLIRELRRRRRRLPVLRLRSGRHGVGEARRQGREPRAGAPLHGVGPRRDAHARRCRRITSAKRRSGDDPQRRRARGHGRGRPPGRRGAAADGRGGRAGRDDGGPRRGRRRTSCAARAPNRRRRRSTASPASAASASTTRSCTASPDRGVSRPATS